MVETSSAGRTLKKGDYVRVAGTFPPITGRIIRICPTLRYLTLLNNHGMEEVLYEQVTKISRPPTLCRRLRKRVFVEERIQQVTILVSVLRSYLAELEECLANGN